jgi:Tfp pilus assembly protein PilX
MLRSGLNDIDAVQRKLLLMSIILTNIPRLGAQKGGALIAAVAMLLMCLLTVTAMFPSAGIDPADAARERNNARAYYSAKAGIAIAQSRLWHDYIDSSSSSPEKLPGYTGTGASYSAFLDQLGLSDGAEKNLATSLPLGHGQVVDSVIVRRISADGAIFLTVASTGSADENATQTIQAGYEIRTVEQDTATNTEPAASADNDNQIAFVQSTWYVQ